jgi:hypothetical protein
MFGHRSFRYPLGDEILGPEWAGDFLRQLKGYPEHTDPNYIRNQRDACNEFLDWFTSDAASTYSELLRQQHLLAACGKSKKSFYSIRLPNGQWLEPQSASSSHIAYFTPDTKCWRETYPGQFRSDLETRGIEHPSADILRLKKHEWTSLLAISAPSVAKIIQWPEGTRIPVCDKKKSCFAIKFPVENTPCTVHVDFRGDGSFVRSAPVGTTREMLFSYVEQCMGEIIEKTKKGYDENICDALVEYYHAAINLMPFSNINNSLFWGQINSILRLVGLNSTPHGRFDIIAMLTSPRAFSEYSKICRNRNANGIGRNFSSKTVQQSKIIHAGD